VLLDYFKYDSIYDFVGNFQGKVWVAEAQGPLVEKLSAIQDFVSSEFLDDVPSGYRLNEILCQDLTQTSFPDNYFDVIITQDVLEHVADAQRAVEEIFRILRPGGIHICTVPVQWDLQETLIRASVISGKLTHHLEPVFHGDPIRSDGALAYTDFGSDICLKFLEKIGKTVIYTSNANLKDQKKFAIYNNWVFVSTKPLINLDLTLNKT
jgi:SAM-dependent methyltransferase